MSGETEREAPKLHRFDETDRLIRLSDALAAVPGGDICDPQQIADELRLIPAAQPAMVALTDDQIDKLWTDACETQLRIRALIRAFARAVLAASQP